VRELGADNKEKTYKGAGAGLKVEKWMSKKYIAVRGLGR